MTDATSRRVREIGESPTLAISAEAKRLRAAGVDVISFGAGEPDFATAEHIVEAARAACTQPAMHRYSPTGGLPALREAIATKTARDSGLQVSPQQVIVSNGGKHALSNVFQALVEPGDEVIVPAPYWVSYPEQVTLAGGAMVTVSTTAADGYRVTPEQLEQARTPATKALVFVSPSNPTGAVYTPDQVRAIGRWAADTGIWVICDEIYEHLVYDGATFTSIPAVVEDLLPRSVVVNGVAKTFAMTGWRVGWSISPAPVAAAINRLQSHTTSHVCNIAQQAALTAIEGPMDQVERMRRTYDRRRRRVHEVLADIDDVACPLPEGAFYVFPDVRQRLRRPVGGTTVTTSVELCTLLLDEAQVALVPGEGFGAPGHVRLSYALSDDDLEKGLTRIAEVLQ
ncbi:MAG: pyridoxal phosphate-dependent aminotransferase [Actinobacteria bacterium]|nr:pyridoxal phosphate-dependent aminotransferase [Actinomycetota bacterium]